jgi:hypothetical protein
MSTRAELRIALQKAEAAWRGANHELDIAQAELTKANAIWDQLLVDRRKAVTDRRKPGTIWNGPFPDRRIAATDRRQRDGGVAALAKKVADQHGTYIERSKAETGSAAAKTKLDIASAARNKLIAALDALDRAHDG